MLLPTKIKLGSRLFQINYPHFEDKKDGESLKGLCNYDRHWIEIYPNKNVDLNEVVSKTSMELTLLHELIHLVLFQIGHTDLAVDEDFVERLSEKLHEVFIQLEGNKNKGKKKVIK